MHQAVSTLDKGLFPKAFCRIFPDYLGSAPDHVNILHADGAGTKSALAYLYWKETGDLSVWRGIAQDAIVMNLDDLFCAGAVDGFAFSSSLARNKRIIPGEVIREIINGSRDFFERMGAFGISIHYLGGETADIGDLARTVIVDGTMACRLPRADVITNEKIRAGDCIVGLSSSGKATYEQDYNSGMGSNGLTSARHDLLHHDYWKRFPETADPAMDEKLAYCGPYRVTDANETPLDTGKLLLSPTRTYAPVLKEILESGREKIHGLVHCTGGGQTKCLHFMPDSVSILKDNLFDPPPVFRMIRACSGSDWREMYQVFNMGHRMELFLDPSIAERVTHIAEKYQIGARIIGKVLPQSGYRLMLRGDFGEIRF